MLKQQANGLLYAASAGILGTLASVFFKIAFSTYLSITECKNHTFLVMVPMNCTYVIHICRFGSVVCVILSNMIMWRCFAKALAFCSTSVEATIGSSLSSFLSSALIGWLFFEERLTYLWCVGILFIGAGLALMHDREKELEHTDGRRKDD